MRLPGMDFRLPSPSSVYCFLLSHTIFFWTTQLTLSLAMMKGEETVALFLQTSSLRGIRPKLFHL